MTDSRADWVNFSAPLRSVALRAVPRRLGCGGFVFSAPKLGFGEGAPGAEDIGGFGANRPKYGGYQGGMAKI